MISSLLLERRSPLVFLLAAGALARGVTAEGRVLAIVDPRGVLQVLGDSADNRILVERTGMPGEFRVVGFDTLVNGRPSVVLRSESVTVRLGEGADHVQVDGLIGGSVALYGGPGDDVLSLGCPVIGGRALLHGGEGEDLLDVQDTLVNGSLHLVGGPGDDEVLMFFAVGNDELRIEGGPGEDSISVTRQLQRGALAIDGGSGDDRIELGHDEITLDTLVIGGSGEDRVSVTDCEIGGALGVYLGSQADDLTVGMLAIEGAVVLDGGSGRDGLVDLGGNDFAAGPPTVRRFEF